MSKGFWAVFIVVMVGLVGIFALSGGKSSEENPYLYSDASVIQEADHISGDGSVVITEYGDFQCPACRNLFPILEQVKAELDVQVVFRHFPLTSIHPQAMAAHRAAEAAGRQGKFFEMHDLLYARQDAWSGSTDAVRIFETYAEELELDMTQYSEDVASTDVFNRINADIDSARSIGAASTPTIVINGQLLDFIPTSVEEFQAAIDAVTANADANSEGTSEESTEATDNTSETES